MKATIRPYRTEDFETLYQIDQACYPPGIAYSRRTLHFFVHLPDSDCLVAEGGGEIVGFILCEFEGWRAHIITIDVPERHRRHGVGTALLSKAEERLIARGVRLVELETATDNNAAIAFWQKHGYGTRGVYPRYYLGRVDALVMSKPLPGPKVN